MLISRLFGYVFYPPDVYYFEWSTSTTVTDGGHHINTWLLPLPSQRTSAHSTWSTKRGAINTKEPPEAGMRRRPDLPCRSIRFLLFPAGKFKSRKWRSPEEDRDRRALRLLLGGGFAYSLVGGGRSQGMCGVIAAEIRRRCADGTVRGFSDLSSGRGPAPSGDVTQLCNLRQPRWDNLQALKVHAKLLFHAWRPKVRFSALHVEYYVKASR